MILCNSGPFQQELQKRTNREDIPMKYLSTRDKTLRLSAAEAIKMGLSRDGGPDPGGG